MIELIKQGMSAAQIAKTLGLTRGQVLGKMHRLRLKTKNTANFKKDRTERSKHRGHTASSRSRQPRSRGSM